MASSLGIAWRMATLVALVAGMAAAPTSGADEPVDVHIVIAPGAEPTYDGPHGTFALTSSEPGQRFVWTLDLDAAFTVAEIRMEPGAFEVARARQVVPLRDEPGVDYPLFNPYPGPDVWNVQDPVRVFHYNVTADGGAILRLGLPGPGAGTLTLVRDTLAPTFSLGPFTDLGPNGFQQEAQTDELALGELQVRPTGSDQLWTEHPTTAYHFLQRFPVVGLDPDTPYEVRYLATDWAGNIATSELYTVRTQPMNGTAPQVTPLAPEPDAVVPGPRVEIVAAVDHPAGPVATGAVRLFVDAREVPGGGFTVDDGTVRYVADGLESGPHLVSVEARLGAGPLGWAKWSFVIEERVALPAPALVLPVVLLFAAAWSAARQRPSAR